MKKMVLANLVHRPMRSLISIVAIAVEVTLILLIVGLSLGILNDNKERTKGTGADILVRPPGSSYLAGLGSSPVSAKIADVLRKLPHVAAVAPVAAQTSTGSSIEVIYGIDLQSFESLRPFRYIEGGPFQGPDDVIVDDYFAASRKPTLHTGDHIDIFNHTFRVAGIVENGHGARKFIPMETMQALTGSEGKASIFYVRADDSNNAELIVEEIKKVPGLEKYNTMSMREWLSLMTPGNIPGFSAFIKVVVGIAVIIGFIVIFQAMYTAVMERTREIGILKSMGASKAYIVNVIVGETIVLAIAGIICGILISIAARLGILAKFPTLRVEMTGTWIIYATIIALIGAILGGIYPAFKAARKDPIDALAYE
ncbi:MAG: ABC transporter permease [Terriglobales bacterium]|jgi:putative ABC transport system permease protein